MQAAAHALTQQFLAWVAEAPRTYAIADGLIRFENGSGLQQSRLALTPRGQAWLKLA
jgi:hypothetical protein